MQELLLFWEIVDVMNKYRVKLKQNSNIILYEKTIEAETSLDAFMQVAGDENNPNVKKYWNTTHTLDLFYFWEIEPI